MEKIDETLAARERTHGVFVQTAFLDSELKDAIYASHNNRDSSGPSFRSFQRYGVDMICGKLARISCGDAFELDHWRDLAGYALLVVKELEEFLGKDGKP